ncbi:hypothetical protein HZS_5400 [Henneguya salminicola]|nr:hypothetical protein HZS_5400 [Henneguya salminicola]
MGVPAFFRWISCRYPSIISHCIELKSKRSEGENIEIDKNLPNPNGIEVDNLYLDMNGIIHPCSHPQNKYKQININQTCTRDTRTNV